MADRWLSTAIRKSWPNPYVAGSTYWDGSADVRSNPLLVLHTTEGHDSCPGYQNSVGTAGGYAPNFTIVVKARQLFQHIPANRAGRALPYYNNCGVQVEITGSCSIAWSKQAGLNYVGDYTAEDLAFIDKCLTQIMDLIGVKHVSQHAFASYEALAAGTANVRLTVSQLNATSGIIGHQHVPSGGHIDPGVLGTAVTPGLTSTPTPAPARVLQDASPFTVAQIKAWQQSKGMPVCDGLLDTPSAFVERLQRDLNGEFGKDPKFTLLVVDGLLGPATEAAVCRDFKVATWAECPAALEARLHPAPAPAPKPAPAPAPVPKPAPPQPGPLLKVTTPRMHSNSVRNVQAGLILWFPRTHGAVIASTGGPDGYYGPGTAQGVSSFQKAVGLVADGVVGPKTWAALAKYKILP